MPAPLLTLALDRPVSSETLGKLLEMGKVGIVKIGLPSLLTKPEGSTRTYAAVAQVLCLRFNIPLFYDFKLADTPDTNANVIKALSKGGYVTISTTLYSPEDLRTMVELCTKQEIQPVAVSLTTATEKHPLVPNVTRNGFILSEVARTVECGFTHIVCDGSILSRLQGSGIKTHVPGIRPAWYPEPGNHQHTIEPAQAAHFGAYSAILGRPLLDQTETGMILATNLAHQELHSVQSAP